jgi:DNA-binding LacI/PurR family transcriptional regulator
VAVPGRLALLGFGDFAIARQLQPALSSVSLPRYEIGAEAAKSLLDALRDHQPAQAVSLPWTLVGRGSTAA